MRRSGVKQGKQRESTGLNDKAGDSSNANGKQREREVSNERNTLYYGGRQNEETGLLTDIGPVNRDGRRAKSLWLPYTTHLV